MKISFGWNWEANKPSQVHCVHCGFLQTIVPTADDLKNGFDWYCVKCGFRFNQNGLKPIEPKTTERTIDRASAPQDGRSDSPGVDPPASFDYPQTNRLFERKKVTDWIALMVGNNVLDVCRIASIGSKLKAAYRWEFDKDPRRERNINTYSGLELNACIERVCLVDKALAKELQTLHLEKIRSEVDVGSIILGSKDIGRAVVEIGEDRLVLDFNGELKSVDRSSVMSAIQADPTKNF